MNEQSDKEERSLTGALPCPFCGGSKITTYPGSTFRWRYAACDECGAQCSEVRINTMTKPRGEATKRHKLTASDVLEIRASFVRHGVKLTNANELAPKYGVEPQTVINAALGRTWSHIK